MRDLFQFELMLPTGGSYGGGNAINNQFNMIDKSIRRGIDSILLDRWGDGGGSSSDGYSYPRPTIEPGLGNVPLFGFFGAIVSRFPIGLMKLF